MAGPRIEPETDLRDLEAQLRYRFQNPELLRRALTHSSFAFENPEAGPSNERLEFLGDAVLNLVVSDLLLRANPGVAEGRLTRWRAALVNTRYLAHLAKKMRLGNFLRLGRGEEHQGGRQKPSLLADALEAVIAAIYLDGGLEAARKVIDAWLAESLGGLDQATAVMDYKTLLQEMVQKNFKQTPEYDVMAEDGPAHARIFTVAVRIGEQILARGRGRSKKEAAQEAAKAALAILTATSNS